jgi:hypothetical protein
MGCPPDRAENFLGGHFGGGLFVLLLVRGDMNDPHSLREMRRLADKIATHPKVSAVRHVGEALALSNKAMVGQLRIPDTSAQVRMLYSFMIGDPAVAQLVSAEKDMGLVHIQVSSNKAEDLDAVLDFAEKSLASELITRFEVVAPGHARWGEAAKRKSDMVTWRLMALAKMYGVGLPEGVEGELRKFLEQPPPALDRTRIRVEMLRFLKSEECAMDLAEFIPATEDPALAAPTETQAVEQVKPDPWRRVSENLAALDALPSEEELLARLGQVLSRPKDDEDLQDLVWSVATPLEEAFRDAQSSQLAAALIEKLKLRVPEGGKGKRFVSALGAAFWDQDNKSVLLALAKPQQPSGAGGQVKTPAVGALQMQANGLPVLHRGLSISVKSNQIKSMVFAVLVIVIMLSLLFRSFWTGLLAATPTLLTLVVIYGGMGLLGVHLDIGTSMLASIILGVGVDYAVHLVAAWHPRDGGSLASSAANAADHTGPAIWTNAVMIFFGFFVLTLGEARPLQNVGSLTAAAMLVAALATFLAIPVLARKNRYRRNPACQDDLESSEAVDAVLNKALPIKS